MKILVVCLGNICRSPLAEGLLRRAIAQRDLDWEVDSAGTGDWHTGEPPDHRSITVAADNALDISAQRARRIIRRDLEYYDLVLTMDRSNYRDVLQLAPAQEHREKVHLILEYAYPERDPRDVPDPYWDDNGFSRVYQMLEEAAHRVVERLLKEKGQVDKWTGGQVDRG